MRRETFSETSEAQATTAPALLFQGVEKTYAGRGTGTPVTALRSVDLEVPQGAIVGVIGPSGAGKSTLIRLGNGLEQVTAGQVSLFGRDVSRLDERGWRMARRQTGMIFQHFNLLASRTAAENIALPLEVAGTSRAQIRAKVTALLDLVGLSDKAARYPAELSGGQKQRVGIARALATDPKLLLCDEATSALDPDTTRAILGLLREVNTRLGVSILLITHEIPVIKEICDQVAVLEAGRIVESGPVFDVMTSPKDPITARFVEAVTGVEPPPGLSAALRTEPVAGGRRVLRLRFAGTEATAYATARLTDVYGAGWRLVVARVDEISGRPYGGLIVTVPNESGPFNAEGIHVETLGYLERDNV